MREAAVGILSKSPIRSVINLLDGTSMSGRWCSGSTSVLYENMLVVYDSAGSILRRGILLFLREIHADRIFPYKRLTLHTSSICDISLLGT